MDAFNDVSPTPRRQGAHHGARLYLDGFPASMAKSELTALVAPFGTVRAVDILTGLNGRPLRVAVVEMARAEEAEAVVRALDRTTLDGALLFAFVAPEDRSPASRVGTTATLSVYGTGHAEAHSSGTETGRRLTWKGAAKSQPG